MRNLTRLIYLSPEATFLAICRVPKFGINRHRIYFKFVA